ncbi:MAG: hypothetical protein IPN86_14025 [Saprospiraceae bacterium]|nr:hypothetical protein [Saprospiraceae bacterium]
MKIFIICFVLVFTNIDQAKSQVYSIGTEIGLIRMKTKVKDGGTNVFVPHQAVGYDVVENVKRIYIKFTKKLVYEIDYSRAIYTNYICTKNNIISQNSIKECLGELFSTNQINLSLGKEIYIVDKLKLVPFFGLGYVSFENFLKGSQPIGLGQGSGGSQNWHYTSGYTNLREDNFNINAKLEFSYKMNPILKLKFFFGFQQGVFRIYENNIVAWQPDNIDVFLQPDDITKLKYAKSESNGSNTQIGIGFEFILNPSSQPTLK